MQETPPFYYATKKAFEAVTSSIQKCTEILKEVAELVEKDERYKDAFYEVYKLYREMFDVAASVGLKSAVSLARDENPRWGESALNEITDFFNKKVPNALSEIRKSINNDNTELEKRIGKLEKSLANVTEALDKVSKYME